MKKIKLVQIISILLFLVYIVLILIDIKASVLGNLSRFYFSILLAVISLNMIWKGKILKSTSTLWFGLSLILYAILIIIFELMQYDLQDLYYLFVFIPIISSVIILVIFGNLIYIKVIIFNIAIAIPVVLYNVLWLAWWWVVVIGVVSIVSAVLISRNLWFNKEKV